MANQKQQLKEQKRQEKEQLKKQQEAQQLEELRLQLKELEAQNEQLRQEEKNFWKQIEADLKRDPLALQLHLELDIDFSEWDEEDKEPLTRYGMMKKGISRDFIVPGKMTLHALHYAIMKAFGLQNYHPHSYVPDAGEFKKMTGGKISEWTRQAGMYFHIPGDEEVVYWDEDYEEGDNFKSWLKSKYCGPYYYGGLSEHYLAAQREIEYFRKKYPEVQQKNISQRIAQMCFGGYFDEIIERPQIWTVLKTPADQNSWAAWRAKKEEVLKPIESDLQEAVRKYSQVIEAFDDACARMRGFSSEELDDISNISEVLDQAEQSRDELIKLNTEYDPALIPVLSALYYCYDDWRFKITCTNAWYDRSEYFHDAEGRLCRNRYGYMVENAFYTDAFDRKVEDEELEHIMKISRNEKPVCIAWDGMNLVEDVGGIDGFCDFLLTINGKHPSEKKEMKEWARSQGWTGRMPKMENIL